MAQREANQNNQKTGEQDVILRKHINLNQEDIANYTSNQVKILVSLSVTLPIDELVKNVVKWNSLSKYKNHRVSVTLKIDKTVIEGILVGVSFDHFIEIKTEIDTCRFYANDMLFIKIFDVPSSKETTTATGTVINTATKDHPKAKWTRRKLIITVVIFGLIFSIVVLPVIFVFCGFTWLGLTSPMSNNGVSNMFLSISNAADVKQIGQVTSNWVNRIVWSPNGKLFAVASTNVDLYNATDRSKLYTFDNVRWPMGLAFSPDGRSLAAGDTRGLHVWNVNGYALTMSNTNAGDIQCLAFASDGKILAAGVGGTVKLFDATTGNEAGTMITGEAVRAVAFSPDGKLLAAEGGSSGNDVIIFNPQNLQQIRVLTGHTGIIESLAFSPDGNTLASGSADNKVILWNPNTGSQLRVITGHKDQVTSVTFSPNGQLLASGSWDLTVKLWNAQTGAQLNSLAGHTGWVNTVAFSPDGSVLASGAEDSSMRFWGP